MTDARRRRRPLNRVAAAGAVPDAATAATQWPAGGASMAGHVDHERRRLLRGTMMTLAARRLGMLGAALGEAACAATPAGAPMPALDGAAAWLNTPPLTVASLRGRVVLVQFWTYSCINWLRTLPYVRVWAERYGPDGLVVLGVHSPEFGFETSVDRVRRAVAEMRIAYPVAVDSDHAVWDAFGNAYWPALYFVDARGTLRGSHFGEGAYDRSERTLQRLLAEAGAGRARRGLARVEGRGVEAPADWGSLRSTETYVGYARAERFASPGGLVPDQRHDYAAPARLRLGEWALGGAWTVQDQPAVPEAPNGRIAIRFHARDLHLVMGPRADGAPVRFRVRVDGRAPGVARGLDVDADGNGAASEPRLFQLVRQPSPVADRLFEIEFLDAGARAFSFTFG